MSKKESSKSRRQVMKEQRVKRQRQQRLATISIIVVFALVVAGILIYPSLQNALTPVGAIVTITPDPRPQANFNAMGDPNAPVKLQEFSDFQCPYCKHFTDDTEQQIVKAYVETGKVYFEYIPYGPGTGGAWIGPESEAAAGAAFCAGDQNKFWEYHDMLFANQTGENVGDFTSKRLAAFAEALNLNMSEFNACVSSNKYSSKIQEGITQGVQAGLQGTPAFLINGQQIIGAQPFSEFQKVIDAQLAAAGQ